MQRAALHTTAKLVLALMLALVHAPALAEPPWKGSSSEPPGKSNAKNKAPTIEGNPSTVAEVDRFYGFQPAASDREGDPLTFSIKNKPSWAAFDTGHGYLSGYPALADAGTETRNIVISVSDGMNTSSLPAFDLLVSAAENRPPVISGTPASEVLAGEAYSFTPVASDPEDQPLVFSAANLPGWASFDASTGKLQGQPSAADAGVYENVRITVSDGTSSASLPAFSIAVVETANGSVTLSWTAPTQNVDGTALLDLAGFRIYYGSTQGQYDRSLDISNPGITTAVIDNLSLGTWYFAATATTLSGLESGLSAEVVRTVQ